MSDLKNKTAIVTGASSGIGLEITKALSQEGCTVLMIARNYEKLKKAAQQIKNTFPFAADVSNEEQIHDVVKKAIQQFKKIDILVNNAGIYKTQFIKDLDMKDFDETIKVNLYGTAICTKLVLPFMLKQNSGTIINISSGLGKHGSPGNAAYCASKYGMLGFADCLDLEIKDKNINVSTILPGQVNTPLFEFLGKDPRREKMLHPKDIADMVVYLCRLPPNVKIKEVSVRPNM